LAIIIDFLSRRNIADAVRERLIIPGPNGGFFGDLAAINMQRGRDHGLPGYIQFSTLCGGPVARGRNFNQLTNIPSSQRRRLDRAYRTVEDIDLFAGLLSEGNLRGSELGLTTTCLMLAQFSRTRHGDRFWYERNDTLTGFTIEQLTEIRKTSLARVICDNSDDVNTIQPKVFERSIIHSPNDDVPCRDLPFVNLNVFEESKYFFLFALSILGILGVLLRWKKESFYLYSGSKHSIKLVLKHSKVSAVL